MRIGVSEGTPPGRCLPMPSLSPDHELQKYAGYIYFHMKFHFYKEFPSNKPIFPIFEKIKPIERLHCL
jgi:hypothetical protein